MTEGSMRFSFHFNEFDSGVWFFLSRGVILDNEGVGR